MARLARLLIVCLGVLLARRAGAEPPPKDPIPDYDGLEKPTTAGEALIWAPRVALSPLWLVTEFGVRAPVGALFRTAEEHHWATKLYDFFTSKDHKMGVLPSAFFDFGVRPSLGFNFFWNDAFAKNNDIRVHFGTWGPTWINTSLSDTYALADRKFVSLRAAFSRRQDHYFYGLGPDSRFADESRYDMNRLDVGAGFDVDGWRLSAMHLAAGVRRVDYGRDGCCGDPTVSERANAGVFALPAHFGRPYAAIYQRLMLVADSRRPLPRPGTGFRASIYGEPVFSPGRPGAESWVRYGGSLGQTVDLTGNQRNLSLTVSADFADNLVGPGVPFNEQVTLGGGTQPAGAFFETKMQGFRYGRLLGRSAAVATLQYTWPIWWLLEGVVQVATGNVFGERLDGFDLDRLRLSGVIGFRTNRERDNHFEVLFGGGTETFRDGLAIESFRLAIGTTSGL